MDGYYTELAMECAKHQNLEAGMLKLRAVASNCHTIDEYTAFLRDVMPIDIEVVEDGIVLHLNKKECTCSNKSYIEKYGEDLCKCTKAREEYGWSLFFGKAVKVEIKESFLRGGNDCVIKIIV